jgi:hypothetical protein
MVQMMLPPSVQLFPSSILLQGVILCWAILCIAVSLCTLVVHLTAGECSGAQLFCVCDAPGTFTYCILLMMSAPNIPVCNFACTAREYAPFGLSLLKMSALS